MDASLTRCMLVRNNGDEDGASLEKMAYKSEWLNMGTTGKPSVGAGNPEKAVRTSLPPLKWGTGSGRSGDEEGANPAMKHSSFFNRTGSTGKLIWRTVVESETEDRVAVTYRSDEPPEESPRIAANGKEGQMQARFELRKPTVRVHLPVRVVRPRLRDCFSLLTRV